MRVRFPLLAPKFCGGSSVVESERAKLGTGVRFSLTALSRFVTVEVFLDCHLPIFARWPRQPDSQSGNAGSNPAGDAGPTRRPVVFFGVPRLGDRACQFARIALLSLSRRPGIRLRT